MQSWGQQKGTPLFATALLEGTTEQVITALLQDKEKICHMLLLKETLYFCESNWYLNHFLVFFWIIKISLRAQYLRSLNGIRESPIGIAW